VAAPNDPDGVLQVWNMHLQGRPEYVFHAQSDILVAKFSPFHPNLMVGGTYSGEVLLWDMRSRWGPVQKSPLTGSGHSHPVYALDIVGTQNAHNIVSCSTDGVVCGWATDMLAQPQEVFELAPPPPPKGEILPRADGLAPTSMAFPRADPTYFVVGSEEGAIYPCHRYDSASSRAGVDARVSYRGHAAPVTAVQYHPGHGPVDLEDLVLSAALDWSVKLWRVRAPAVVAGAPLLAAGGPAQQLEAAPLLDLARDDIVYDAAWSPVKPGVFALVDGAGQVEVWDITADTEVPVAKATPGKHAAWEHHPYHLYHHQSHHHHHHHQGGHQSQQQRDQAPSLNKVAWEGAEGKRLAVGGLSGVVTVFEVGSALGGRESARADEWTTVKKLTNAWDSGLAPPAPVKITDDSFKGFTMLSSLGDSQSTAL
jgi:dynein intermediate chain